MKKLIIILAAAAMTGCGIYKPYSRPEVKTDGLYGTAETADTMTIGNIGWEEMFSDPYLQTLIRQGLENNTDLQSAQWRVKEAEATLKSARLAYLPSFNFAPQGNLSSFDWATPSKTYNIPVTASWQIDIFNGLTNAKRKAKALYAQSREYEQAVKTQVISGVANLYYTLLMLDGQYEVTEQTAEKWRESVRTMRAMKEAGMANEAAVAQYEGKLTFDRSVAARPGIPDPLWPRTASASLLAEGPHSIERGRLEGQRLPDDLTVGMPVQMLSNRPDIRSAEYSLMQSYYATSEARSALYPTITLSGTLGWTNDSGMGIKDPGKICGRQRHRFCSRSLTRQCQPRPREDRQGAAGGDQAGVPAGAAQRRRRGEQRPYAVPVGPREGRSAGTADRSAGARRGEHGTADEAWQHDLSGSADRPAVTAFGPVVSDSRPLRRNTRRREPLSGSRRRS